MIDFQPMPKRFMVWDDEAIDWICVPGTERHIWDLLDLLTHRTGLMRHKFHMKIVQSTNLFDDDDVEIFEGSILNLYADSDGEFCATETNSYGYVFVEDGELRIRYTDGDDESLDEALDDSETVQVLGHIFESTLEEVEQREKEAKREACRQDFDARLKFEEEK